MGGRLRGQRVQVLRVRVQPAQPETPLQELRPDFLRGLLGQDGHHAQLQEAAAGLR